MSFETFYTFTYNKNFETFSCIQKTEMKYPRMQIGIEGEKHLVFGVIKVTPGKETNYDKIEVLMPEGQGVIRKKKNDYSLSTVLMDLGMRVVMEHRLRNF